MKSNVNSKFDESIAYLGNNRLMGLVERAGADIIIESAKQKGLSVEDYWSSFNVRINRMVSI